MNEESSGSGAWGNGGSASPDGHDHTQRIQEFAREASAQMEHARVIFDDLNTRALAFIRRNPGAALLGALAIGYIAGKIASKLK